jgi:UDP-N-acetylmuramoyl-tripeptide--D-alanyl-D-alanine ligase
MEILNILAYFSTLLLLGYYIITTLQWYSYKLERVVFHHTKAWWNIIYFYIPLLSYDFVMGISDKKYGFIISGIYFILFFIWLKGVDKKLVFTGRVKRFFAALIFFGIFLLFTFKIYSLFIPILLAFLVSNFIEKLLFNGFKQRAKKRLDSFENLTIIGVTASYGKTSIKNYIAKVLSQKYKTYATPRSVNTLGGVIKDINEDLPKDTQIYIVEMGARGSGDILEITEFVNPHYVVVGKIGPAHIEYFKTLENIRNTKMEILQSKRLKKAFVHESAKIDPKENPKIEIFGKNIKDIKATLDETCFSLEDQRYCSKVLGSFNAINLAAAVLVAKELGLSKEEIKKGISKIEPTPHRLQKIKAGKKLILDDSFNGNIDGVLSSFELCKLWEGRKVLITAGLVEVDEKLNEEIAKKADEIFDLIVVTSSLNAEIFKKNISKAKFIHLKDKSKLQDFLAKNTFDGDLILFSNDAPSFV